MFNENQINERAFDYYASLRRLRQYVGERYSEGITLEQAAHVAGLEKNYFSTFFHQKVGVCFRHWLAWVRINHAVRLIRSSDYSLTEVAFAIGFGDLRTFERSFKKCTGNTPRDFKKQFQDAVLKPRDEKSVAAATQSR